MTSYKSLKKKLLNFGIFINILLIFAPLNQGIASTTIFFEEKFEINSINDLKDWMLKGYSIDSSNVYHDIDHGFTIDNGKLVSAETTGFEPLRRAIHNSNVVYGEWSFDWIVSTNNKTYDTVEFIFTDNQLNYNLTGATFLQTNYTGYSLILNSYNRELGPGISLLRFDGGNPHTTTLATYKADQNLSGMYHLDISRDEKGEFVIKMNSNTVIEVVDEKYISSEKFAFTSFEGNSSIDNITISKLNITTSENTPKVNGFVAGLVFLTFGTLVIIRKTNKREL